jgi:hypothetical protein
MEENEMVVYESRPADIEVKGGNYLVTVGGSSVTLKRNVDFGRFGKAKKPCLLKSGAEKIVFGYGAETRYDLVESIQDVENGFFMYSFKCSLYYHGQHITDGYGSANSRESACGTMSGFDSANARMKMAKKRSLVDAALMLARCSDMFDQDIENDSFMQNSKVYTESNPEDYITPAQVKRIFAIAGNAGISTEQARDIIKASGYSSTKQIRQKDYETICKKIEEEDK